MNDDPLLDPHALEIFLRTHRLPPLDRFGQHFLTDERVLQDIVAATDTDPTIPVIEIGAGLGVLTQALARTREMRNEKQGTRSAPLIAVELDRRLIPILTERVRAFPSVRIVHADIRKIDVASLLSTPDPLHPHSYDVVGNIPYNITAPILRTFLAAAPRPHRMTLLVDDAVAEAIAAEPPHMSIRAISVQVYAEPTVVRRRIPPSAFVPPPAVHSAILSLVSRPSPLISLSDERAFFRLVRAGFSKRRKTLRNALAATYQRRPAVAAERLRGAGIEPTRRAQTLSIGEWKRLLRSWK